MFRLPPLSSLSFLECLELSEGVVWCGVRESARKRLTETIGIGKNRTSNAIEECTRDGGPSTMVCCRKDERVDKVDGEDLGDMYCFVKEEGNN
jgi:hypothetical protein